MTSLFSKAIHKDIVLLIVRKVNKCEERRFHDGLVMDTNKSTIQGTGRELTRWDDEVRLHM